MKTAFFVIAFITGLLAICAWLASPSTFQSMFDTAPASPDKWQQFIGILFAILITVLMLARHVRHHFSYGQAKYK